MPSAQTQEMKWEHFYAVGVAQSISVSTLGRGQNVEMVESAVCCPWGMEFEVLLCKSCEVVGVAQKGLQMLARSRDPAWW